MNPRKGLRNWWCDEWRYWNRLGILSNWKIQFIRKTPKRKNVVRIWGKIKWIIVKRETFKRKNGRRKQKIQRHDKRKVRRICESYEPNVRRIVKIVREFCSIGVGRYGI